MVATMPTSAFRRAGNALVEFALVGLVLYVILAATIDFGRTVVGAQVAQDSARLAARELALSPLPAEVESLAAALDALEDAELADPVGSPNRIYSARYLVVDVSAGGPLDPGGDGVDAAELDAYFAGAPLVNQLLRPLMIGESFDPGGGAPPVRLLRYPGALVAVDPSLGVLGYDNAAQWDGSAPNRGLTVAIPRVLARDADGVETIEWVPVVEEVYAPDDSAGPPDADALPDPRFALSRGGVVALRVNLPVQGSAMTAHEVRFDAGGAPDPNVDALLTADDAGVDADPFRVSGFERPAGLGPARLPGAPVAGSSIGPYAGTYGLGRQFAQAREVRPFRRLVSAPGIFRREVFE